GNGRRLRDRLRRGSRRRRHRLRGGGGCGVGRGGGGGGRGLGGDDLDERQVRDRRRLGRAALRHPQIRGWVRGACRRRRVRQRHELRAAERGRRNRGGGAHPVRVRRHVRRHH